MAISMPRENLLKYMFHCNYKVGHEYMSGGTESYCYGHIPDCGGSAKRGYSIRHDCRISAQKLHDATYRGTLGVSFDVVQYG
uniref:Uncharacterized protein n=1 Tax=Lactuca sativa TaxID=4236 RepID=A0A9R1XSQ6_LACSA|nr:hypothetical protein LSAT_V11C300102240 [Lactuca sativa]